MMGKFDDGQARPLCVTVLIQVGHEETQRIHRPNGACPLKGQMPLVATRAHGHGFLEQRELFDVGPAIR